MLTLSGTDNLRGPHGLLAQALWCACEWDWAHRAAGTLGTNTPGLALKLHLDVLLWQQNNDRLATPVAKVQGDRSSADVNVQYSDGAV